MYFLPKQDRLVSVLFGLLRKHKFHFLHLYRDEAYSTIKSTIRQVCLQLLNKVTLACKMRSKCTNNLLLERLSITVQFVLYIVISYFGETKGRLKFYPFILPCGERHWREVSCPLARARTWPLNPEFNTVIGYKHTVLYNMFISAGKTMLCIQK